MLGNAVEEGMLTPTSPEDTGDEHLAELFRHWQTAKGAAAFPHPDSLDYIDFPEMARGWCVLDVIDDGQDFQCRFFGPDFANMVGMDITGKRMSAFAAELPGDVFRERALYTMRKVMAEQTPLNVKPRRSVAQDKEYVYFASLTLPFAHDGKTISRILHAVRFLPGEHP